MKLIDKQLLDDVRKNQGTGTLIRKYGLSEASFAGTTDLGTTELGIIGVTEVRSAEPRKKG